MNGSRSMGFGGAPAQPEAGPVESRRPADGTVDRSALEGRLAELRGRLDACEWRDPELLVRAAGLCAELGQRGEAVNMLQRALEFDPRHAYARSRLAELATPEEMDGISQPIEIVPLTRQPLEPFAYPLRGMGWIMILLGGVFFGLLFAGLGVALAVPVVFPVALAIALVFVGYLIDFFRKVTMNSATGGKEAPDWPDLDFGQFVLPIKATVIYVAAMMPAVVFAIMVALEAVSLGEIGNPVAILVLTEMGGLVLPMAMLIFFVRRSALEALNPVRVFRSIAACGKEYWLAAGICLVIAPLRKGIMILLSPLPVIGLMLSTAVTIYFAMVACRALGLVYRAREHRLDW